MSLRLRLLELHATGWVRRAAIRRLSRETAVAFGTTAHEATDVARGGSLERYVEFTARASEDVLADAAGIEAVSGRLRTNAFRLGSSMRRTLGIRTRAEAFRAVRVAYRFLDIDLDVDARGSVRVERCPFADAYSPAACDLMSALDAGLVDGLTGGGALSFSERITEGRPRCRATIAFDEVAA
jgi:hypothetical protein